MAFQNFPAAATQQPASPPKFNWMGLITGIMFFALVGAVGYIYWYKKQTSQLIENATQPMLSNSAQQDALKKELADVTRRYETLKALFMEQKDSTGNAQDTSIREKKDRIALLLSKLDATQEELGEAKKLINSLRTDIQVYRAQVSALVKDTAILMQEKRMMLEDRQFAVNQQEKTKGRLDSALTLIKHQEDIIDVGTTLNAVNFNILSVGQKRNGKEIETLTARKVERLRITFEVGENRIATSGMKEIYVCLTGPDGIPIAVEAFGSGKFFTRDGTEKFYTEKLDINYIQGKRQTISFDWSQNSIFEPGDYKITVYNNGFKIGEGLRRLKKK